MKIKTVIIGILAGVLALGLLPQPTGATATPDQYVGDTSIYSGNPADIQPNVLIILDTSGSMNDDVLPGNPYTSATVYPVSNACSGAGCATNTVYRCTAFGLECGNWVAHVANVSTVVNSCPTSSAKPYTSLTTTGQWNSSNRRLRTDGTCTTGSGIYATGNWINWRQQVGTPEPKITIAKRVVQNIVSGTSGVRIGLMVFNNNQGSTFHSYNGYTAYVKDMDAIFSGSTTNRQALLSAIAPITASSWTPLAESLFEAMRYYQGGASAFNGPITYSSPIQESCQQNYVVLITDGMSTQDRDNVLQTICTNGDCDGDGFEPGNDPAKSYPNSGSDYLDDVAKYMHDNDMSTAFSGTQNVITYTVGFGLGGANAGAVKLLSETAANGGGEAFLSNDETELTEALTQILGQIFEVNSSFVAPVVPVSPENRTYSGSRVYLGFFKPQSGTAFWLGNLKKYAIDNSGNVVDKNGNYASYVDANGNGLDDRDGAVLPTATSDGAFRDTAVSYWTSTPDAGEVDSGGVGYLLYQRTAARSIFTYRGTSTNLADPSNLFTPCDDATTTCSITPATLGVSTTTDKNNLINFVHGLDAYDDDSDGNRTEKREWVLADILHSKPVVVNYASYTFTSSSEADCNTNRTMIYVGANDGMLHAFKDCDGSEAWSFIPQDLLSHLTYLPGNTHTYFVDSSPSLYIYDADKDGNIESGDKVILIFGERRGGGFYYALDVSNPDAPVYLWRLSATESPSGTNTDYAELAESWSEPTITKMKIGTQVKVVAVIGAGYDNANEDGRYGATQTFSGFTGPHTATGEGSLTSSGTASPTSPKGRGVYMIEVATLDSSGVPSFTNRGRKVWGYTYGSMITSTTHTAMTFSIPGAVTVVDRDNNGYADKLYVGDMGGNIFALGVGNIDQTVWSGRRIFSANPGIGGTSDTGRKMFYRPSVTFEVTEDGQDYEMLFFGTGDREHPLNTAVVDRMYAVKDTAQTTAVQEDDTGDVYELVDVTLDILQESTTTDSQIAQILTDLDNKYGWFIKLNQNAGEKVLAPALAFAGAYYTTYAPNPTGSSDPCAPGNLGTARVYLVNSKTGEAIYDADTSNNPNYNTISNVRAKGSAGEVLQRSDRSIGLGSGIPSGVVLIISSEGKVTGLIGCGGALCIPPSPPKGGTFPVYWMRTL